MELKRCNTCGKRKPRTAFHLHRGHKDKLQSSCGACQKRYFSEWMRKHPGVKRLRNLKEQDRRRAWLDRYLSRHPCTICGEDDIGVLEFHHRNPRSKIAALSEMIRRGHGLKSVRAEIAKCDVVCANCHRRITRKQWSENKKVDTKTGLWFTRKHAQDQSRSGRRKVTAMTSMLTLAGLRKPLRKVVNTPPALTKVSAAKKKKKVNKKKPLRRAPMSKSVDFSRGDTRYGDTRYGDTRY